MKRTIRANIDHLPYSLHDMRVTEMIADGDGLTLRFAGGFVKIAQPCARVAGEIYFSRVDWDFCFVYILDFWGNSGPFTGRKEYLRDFVAANPALSFEIVNEAYGYNSSRFSGYLWLGREMRECVMEIYHLGDMEYRTQEEA